MRRGNPTEQADEALPGSSGLGVASGVPSISALTSVTLGWSWGCSGSPVPSSRKMVNHDLSSPFNRHSLGFYTLGLLALGPSPAQTRGAVRAA